MRRSPKITACKRGSVRALVTAATVASSVGLAGCGREVRQPAGSAADPALSVAAGNGFTCAALRSGKTVCWGLSTIIVRGIPPLRLVSASGDVACGVGRDDAKAYCWTLENLGSPNDRLAYRVVARGIGRDIEAISSNVSTCVLMGGGAEFGCANDALTKPLKVVARADHGQRVDAFSAGFPPCWTNPRASGVRCGSLTLFPDSVGVRSVSADRSVCVVDAAGKVRCAQTKSDGLGISAGLENGVPAARQVEVRSNVGCAVTVAVEVWCWGENRYGSLGDGSYDELGRESKARRVMASLRFRSVSVGDDSHACAIIDGGYVACWGNNYQGELGMGDADRRKGVVIATMVR